ncbi:hypothetical protein [uncultured Tateyamaria sp.]|uniref:hypothetical protein n=1 Tax=uncultured Tateyamaria sp. TaxID=455651 RepID=UPI00260587D3|nr:hypothetical protein [uncultured Tateyamaria sp.]
MRSLDTDANEDYTLGGARRDGVGIITTVNFGRSQTTQCVVSVFREDNSAAAQAMVDTIAAAGFGLTPISARNRAQQSWSISGAPAGTTVNVSSRSSRSVGVWIAWP